MEQQEHVSGRIFLNNKSSAEKFHNFQLHPQVRYMDPQEEH